MTHMNTKKRSAVTVLVVMVVLLLASGAYAAVPGISSGKWPATGAYTFSLTAHDGYITQPDGMNIYSWGYGCVSTFTPIFAPYTTGAFCPTMQVPGPTLIVTEGQTVTVNLTNNLPTSPGGTAVANASIVFPGFQVNASCASGSCVQGLQTMEATAGATVSYTFTAASPGTRAYYSGTQPDLQIELGMYGAIIVLPNPTLVAGFANCSALGSDNAQKLGVGNPMVDMRLAPAAYDHPESCYDRELLFQWMELDPRIHQQAQQQVQLISTCTGATNPTPDIPCPTELMVSVEPYRPAYFLINGRSMPDDMDPSYAPNYPNQPYNGNPHMHPGDLLLVRTIGQGHWRHPFHEHANHVRILARDANLILSQNDSYGYNGGGSGTPRLAGRMEFTTDTYPGASQDGIFYWSGKGLGWDIYGHTLPQAKGYIATASETGNVVTAMAVFPTGAAAYANSFQAGANFTVTGMPTGYNGGFQLTSATTPVSTLTVTVTAPGSGYTSLPGVTISAPPCAPGPACVQASAVASLGVVGIGVGSGTGSGYTSTPTVNITGGGGTGAAAVAYVDLIQGDPHYGQITSIAVTSQGSGYTSVPAISFTGGGGGGASATASLGVVGLAVTNPGAGYAGGSPATVTISGGGGSGATATGATGAQAVTFTYTDPVTGLGAYSMPSSVLAGTVSFVTGADQYPCHPDANGFYTVNSNPPAPIAAVNYYEWCADHDHPLEANPGTTNPNGQVGSGGPATLFDPLIATNGLWFNGTPYLGPDAVSRSRGNTPLPVGSATQNPFLESGLAFMWHSHNEREITTNDVFPGGMFMMMLVDPPTWWIDETL